MSIVLRILAALVMLVGVAGLIYMGAKLLHEDELRGAWFIRDFYFELSGLNTAAIALGGMLWALTRLAYRPSAAAASAPSAIPDANTVRRKRDVMGGLLRVIGLMQIGIGFVVFVVFYYAFVTQQKQGQGEPPWGWLFYLTVAALGYVSLGGIVLALTRMADPPRSRP